MSSPPTAENSPTRSPECCTETEIEIETGSRSASLGGHGDDRNHDRDRFNSVSSANSTGSGNRTLVEELRSLRDENRQLKHEKSAWTGTKREIELDLAMADGEAQLAAQRIDALEIELRRQASLVETSNWTQDELESELRALQSQLEKTLAEAPQHDHLVTAVCSGLNTSHVSSTFSPVVSPDVDEGNAAVALGEGGAWEDADSNPNMWWDDADGADAELHRDDAPARLVSSESAASDDPTQREQVLAQFEATMVLYEEELQRQRRAYQDELDEREAEIQRLQTAACEQREASAAATAAAAASDDDGEAIFEESIADMLTPMPASDGIGTDDEEFFDAEGPTESELVLESLGAGGACSLDELLERLRVSEAGADWGAPRLRRVLYSMETRNQLLLKIDETGDEPVLLFHAQQPLSTPQRSGTPQ